MATNCNTASLNTYIPSTENPWTEEKVRHLYRRIGFGATDDTIREALTLSPANLIDNLINEAINDENIQNPGWGYWNYSEFETNYEAQFGITTGIVADTRSYLEKLFLNILRNKNLKASLLAFWSNHFVTEDLSSPSYLFQQLYMRLKNCIGNFKDFVYDVGLDNMMLQYLNGFDNKAGSPNENYARELFELFTLGVDNGYTETDIAETAKALTGYNSKLEDWDNIVFNENTFDNSEKTIFGQTGNWGYDDVIRILFEEKANLIANYICSEFYKFYVSPNINDLIIEELATVFIENNFEIAPVLSTLFKSEHFFDEQSFGTIIKSPLDLIITLQNELEMDLSSDPNSTLDGLAWDLLYYLDYNVFNPPNVSGWPTDESWINSITLPERWTQVGKLLDIQKNLNYEVFADFAKKRFDTNETVENIVKGIVNFFTSKNLVFEIEYQDAIDEFKGDVPENYFEDGTWNLNYPTLYYQVYSLLTHISKMPEFQIK